MRRLRGERGVGRLSRVGIRRHHSLTRRPFLAARRSPRPKVPLAARKMQFCRPRPRTPTLHPSAHQDVQAVTASPPTPPPPAPPPAPASAQRRSRQAKRGGADTRPQSAGRCRTPAHDRPRPASAATHCVTTIIQSMPTPMMGPERRRQTKGRRRKASQQPPASATPRPPASPRDSHTVGRHPGGNETPRKAWWRGPPPMRPAAGRRRDLAAAPQRHLAHGTEIIRLREQTRHPRVAPAPPVRASHHKATSGNSDAPAPRVQSSRQ